MNFKQKQHIKSLENRVFGHSLAFTLTEEQAALYINRLKALLLEDGWTFPTTFEKVFEETSTK